MLTFLQNAHFFLHYSNQKINHSTFPLYRLPLLPILNVFSSLNSVELFNLSRTSSKLRAFIKTTTIWKQIRIDFVFRSDGFLFLLWTGFRANHIFVFPREYKHLFYDDFSDKGAGNEAKVWYKKHSIESYWNNSVLGIETIGNYLLEMFDEPKIKIIVAQNAAPLIEPVVGWLKKRNIRELNGLWVQEFSKNVDEIYWIMKQFTIRKILYAKTPLDYSSIRWHLRSLENAVILKSEFLKIDDILIIDPIVLCISESPLTSQDLNRFLKNWKNGTANSRLKYFRMVSKTRVSKQQVLMDIEGVERSRNETRSYYLNYYIDEGSESSAGGFDIERIDGIKATIHVYINGFRIIIWPDFQGNMF